MAAFLYGECAGCLTGFPYSSLSRSFYLYTATIPSTALLPMGAGVKLILSGQTMAMTTLTSEAVKRAVEEL